MGFQQKWWFIGERWRWSAFRGLCCFALKSEEEVWGRHKNQPLKFQGKLCRQGEVLLSSLNRSKCILVPSWVLLIYAHSRKQSFLSLLRSRGCNFRVLYSKVSFFLFFIAELYICIIGYRYIYCIDICILYLLYIICISIYICIGREETKLGEAGREGGREGKRESERRSAHEHKSAEVQCLSFLGSCNHSLFHSL